MIVCLDTHILVWGIKGQADPGQENQILRSKALLKALEARNDKIVIPSPVLAEFLIGVPHDKLQSIPPQLNKFEVAPFDAKAAWIFAQIWTEKNMGRTLSEDIKQELSGITRKTIKFDCQIVSIAVSCGANVIYSHDSGVKLFADGKIKVLEAPEFMAQDELGFEEAAATLE